MVKTNKQNTETPKQTNIKRFKTSIMKLVFTRKSNHNFKLLAAAGFLGIFTQSMGHSKGASLFQSTSRLVLFHPLVQITPPHNSPSGRGQGTKLSTCIVIFLLSHRSEGQRGLPSFRVRHSKNSNQFTWRKWAHALRGKQDKLSETLGICHLQDHVHRNSPINHILKNKDKRISFAISCFYKSSTLWAKTNL